VAYTVYFVGGDVLGFWNSGGIFLSLLGIVRDGRIGKQGKDPRAMQYLALMLQDIGKWNGENGSWTQKRECVFGNARSGARMDLRDLYSTYYSTRGKPLHTVTG
jgi:hypothetical protein